MTQFKRYLGDGIDMDYDGQHVILTMAQKGRVYLKPNIIDQFQTALAALQIELKRKKRRVSPEQYFKRTVK